MDNKKEEAKMTEWLKGMSKSQIQDLFDCFGGDGRCKKCRGKPYLCWECGQEFTRQQNVNFYKEFNNI